MRIPDSLSGLTAGIMRHLENDFDKAARSMTSGDAITQAADDPAGMAVAEKLESQIRSREIEIRNAQDAISLVQTADGALSGMQDILQHMNELSLQAANGTCTMDDRALIAGEFDQLNTELTDIAQNTNYNGIPILFNAGPESMGLNDVSLSSRDGAEQAATAVQSSIHSVSEMRTSLGTHQTSLEPLIRQLAVASENLTAAQSRLTDADFAQVSMALASQNILNQSSTAVMAHANFRRDIILGLLE
ncbi:MAG: flagellin [Solirubrobacterales bacterium]